MHWLPHTAQRFLVARIDIHTHVDAQVTYDPYCDPAATNGIGTMVFGNCGCGFAPVLKEDRTFIAEVMEGVEEIPKAALDGTPESLAKGGMEWSWESFPEFMDVVESRPLALDVAAYVPHCALRTYRRLSRATLAGSP